MCLFSINVINPYPENIDRNILKIIIHLSGKNADVLGNTTHENEPNSEIIRGIFSMMFLDFMTPITPVGTKKPLISKNKITKFNAVYGCGIVSFSRFPNIILFLIISKLVMKATTKITLVAIAIIATSLSLFIKEYITSTDDSRKPIILSESTEIIDSGKIANIILFEIFGNLDAHDRQKSVMVSPSMSL
jgi:hypothetical protein